MKKLVLVFIALFLTQPSANAALDFTDVATSLFADDACGAALEKAMEKAMQNESSLVLSSYGIRFDRLVRSGSRDRECTASIILGSVERDLPEAREIRWDSTEYTGFGSNQEKACADAEANLIRYYMSQIHLGVSDLGDSVVEYSKIVKRELQGQGNAWNCTVRRHFKKVLRRTSAGFTRGTNVGVGITIDEACEVARQSAERLADRACKRRGFPVSRLESLRNDHVMQDLQANTWSCEWIGNYHCSE